MKLKEIIKQKKEKTKNTLFMQQIKYPTTISLLSYGTFGKPVNGYVEINIPFPTFIKKIQLVVVSCFTGVKLTGVTPPPVPPLTIDSNIDQWQRLTSYLSPILTVDCTENIVCERSNLNTSFIKELPPGIHRFPFSFILPQTHCPMLVLPNEERIRFVYEIKAIVYTKVSSFDSDYFPLPMLFHTVPPLQLSPSKVETPFGKDSKVTLTIPKTTYFTGERMDITMTLSLGKPIYRAHLSLVAMYTAPGCIHRITLNSTVIPLGPEPKRFLIDILPSVPPTIVTQFFKFEHFILIEIFTQIGAPLKIFIPVTIITSQDNNIRSYYAKVCGVLLPSTPYFGIHNRPPPPFPSSIIDGLQEGVTEFSGNVWLNHIKRCLQRTKDGDPMDEVYPLFTNSMLPEGWITGNSHNETYYIDVIHKTTSWKDPRDINMIKPQHVLAHSKGVLNILPINAEGLPCCSKKQPEVVVMVFTDFQRVLRTEPAKGSDPTFTPKTLAVELDDLRENVNVFLYVKGNPDIYLGNINIDLTLLPFPSIIEDWFYLQPIPFTDNVTSGRIKLRLAYLEHPMALTEVNPMLLTHVLTSLNSPFFPMTPKYEEEVDKQLKRMENGSIRMIKKEGNRIVLTWERNTGGLVETKYENTNKGSFKERVGQLFTGKKKDAQEEVPLIDVHSLNGNCADDFEQGNDLFETGYVDMGKVTESIINSKDEELKLKASTNTSNFSGSKEPMISPVVVNNNDEVKEIKTVNQINNQEIMTYPILDDIDTGCQDNNNEEIQKEPIVQENLLDLNEVRPDPLKGLFPTKK
ncbi:hypothetical protein EHI8A_026000 [Entamoeba histolytica HM-1:IMSS-B]|uniref:WW domain-containing protein n=6 Tax=Entamoeba histolytica TaxID=5759 RepID=C4LU27_ENTH1|nr:hypothetical protein EHI_068340 [Entamoeba histolytica HM-1:IMSS]EMD42977.1 WW domain containing protein [Entamoeba histolytica KU27]EMH73784.1 hypothetical protein EHI8A_026000 [Entamoeba histolytica HM-1:IMSS-B]EMS13451.1 hypothetical protein KM1_062770 [Entamoeba histolytica HM-3:IMSS]ENY60870.1 hypothetical protein EHI7A_029290 [Entamoeba histolytica HM-1:IMSS-A]GAT92095.1 hypothetical protein CL6EHI_068340 [Entamoeba histolytica]|eukprot:XP_654145.2 hypothetical protein EHI_068340 [Entamoeba histolytica HM-1:IMSS]